MTARRTTALLVLAGLFLLAFAYSPLLQAGLTAPDYAALLGGSGEALEAAAVDPSDPSSPSSARGRTGKPLAHGSLYLSRVLWGVPDDRADEGGARVARLFRMENLALLVLSGIALGLFTRRLLLPWSGTDQATAAARSAALFFVLYPLAIPAVATVSSRGDLLGLALASWSAALFLRGRQDRHYAFTAASLVLCLLAGFSSYLVFGLPLLLYSAELVSAHRYRPRRVRLRTAATTLLVFGAAASIDLALSVFREGLDALPPGAQALRQIRSVDALSEQFVRAIEKLGLLVLPANPDVLGLLGWALAGTLFLLAIQPALVAARNAPRLWGWLLVGWFLALLVSELLHAHVRVTPDELDLARALLPSAMVMAFGLALGATAVSGPRRPYIAWVVALGYACLAYGNALPWRGAAEEATRLRRSLYAAFEEFGRGARVFVLDPPPASGGVEPVGDAVAWLAHSDLSGAPRTPHGGLPDVHTIPRAGFLALTNESEFVDRLISTGEETPWVVIAPPQSSDLVESGGEDEREDGSDDARTEGVRESWRIPVPTPSATPQPWRTTLSSPNNLDLATLEYRSLVVTAPSATELEPRVSWKTKTSENGAHAGVWLETAEGLRGIFDLGSSLDWLRAGRVRMLFFEEGTGSIGEAELSSELPTLGDIVPHVRGDDWTFPVPEAPLAKHASGTYTLGLLDPRGFGYTELELGREGTHLVAHGARQEAKALAKGAWVGPIVWILDYRIGPYTVARSRGERLR